MSNKIKVEDVLKKNWCNLDPLKQIQSRDGRPGTVYERLMISIKEIVKGVVNKCSEQGSLYAGNDREVIEKAIESINQEVEYE